MTLHKFPSIEQFRSVVKYVRQRSHLDGLDENNEPIYNSTKKAPKLMFHGTTKLHGCFQKDTLVKLSNGENVRISDMIEGCYIKSFDIKSKDYTDNKVIRVINQSLNKKWVKLIFDSSELICTEDHKIWTNNRGYVEAKDLTVFDEFQTV